MDLEEAVVDTVMRGGDILHQRSHLCGALLCAVWGRDAIPEQWTDCLLHCRPVAGQAHVTRPLLGCFWPVDALDLAKQLINFSSNQNMEV